MLETWLAAVERVAAASGSSSHAFAHVAHARQRYVDKKKQLATMMRRPQEGSVREFETFLEMTTVNCG